MKKDNIVYLEDILECIDKIESFVANLDVKRFLSDELAQSAVLWNLEVLGEAANKISEDFLEENPRLEFKKAIGMRNQLIHGYKKINFETVWTTIKKDLPVLKKQIKEIMGE